MKFNGFREVDMCNQRSGIGYRFFFLFQKGPFVRCRKRVFYYER